MRGGKKAAQKSAVSQTHGGGGRGEEERGRRKTISILKISLRIRIQKKRKETGKEVSTHPQMCPADTRQPACQVLQPFSLRRG